MREWRWTCRDIALICSNRYRAVCGSVSIQRKKKLPFCLEPCHGIERVMKDAQLNARDFQETT